MTEYKKPKSWLRKGRRLALIGKIIFLNPIFKLLLERRMKRDKSSKIVNAHFGDPSGSLKQLIGKQAYHFLYCIL